MVVESEWSELESSTMIQATVKAESFNRVQMHKCLEITAMSFHINWHIALNSVIHLTVRNKELHQRYTTYIHDVTTYNHSPGK